MTEFTQFYGYKGNMLPFFSVYVITYQDSPWSNQVGTVQHFTDIKDPSVGIINKAPLF